MREPTSITVPIAVEGYSMFQRVYEPCACGGWVERYEGRNPLRGSYNGITLTGRRNHFRGCPKRSASTTGSDQ